MCKSLIATFLFILLMVLLLWHICESVLLVHKTFFKTTQFLEILLIYGPYLIWFLFPSLKKYFFALQAYLDFYPVVQAS